MTLATSLILASRPKTLAASLSPVLIGSAFAFKEGKLHPLFFLLVVLFAILIQIGTNFANDYFDFVKGADTEKRKGEPRAMQKGLLTKSQMKKAIFAVFFATFLLTLVPIFKGSLLLTLFAVLSILFGIFYTGGPRPLGYLGLGDILVLLFFGPIAAFGSYYVHTESFNLLPLIAGLGPGFLAVALLTANNIRDIEEDREVNKKTLTVRFGKTFAKSEYLLCLLMAFIFPIFLWQKGVSAIILLASFSLFFSFRTCGMILFQEKNLNIAFKQTALLIPPYALLTLLGVLL